MSRTNLGIPSYKIGHLSGNSHQLTSNLIPDVMGGNAFRQTLPTASFPRLSPAIYAQIKGIFSERLATFFTHVIVPHEAPEKTDHGDVDFIVAGLGTAPSTATEANKGSVTLEDIRTALGARVHIPSPLDMHGISNFAIPLANIHPNVDPSVAVEQFVQVDINVRADEREWERIVFFHAYGDLGMIIGQVAAGVGLHIGEKGLKMSSTALAPTHSTTFVLSDSFKDILRFFTLSMERWEDGFDTRREIFAWVATSRFYNPYRIMTPQNGTKSREMYQEFFAWNEERKSQAIHPTEGRDALVRRVQEEALVFFGRKEFDSLVKSNRRRIRLGTIWNGTKVGEWTEWSGWGRGVGRVMKHLRQTVGEDRIADMTEEEVKELVLEAKKVVEKEREAELATAEGPESLP